MINPQTRSTHSHDHYLRLKRRELEQLVFSHLYSNMTSDPPPAGYTEWTAEAKGSLLSLSWEWFMLDDGAIAQRSASPVLSNLMLIEDAGYDLGPDATEKALQTSLQRLAWERVVGQDCMAAALHQ